MKQTIIYIYSTFLLLSILYGCATAGAPQGGPKDSLPPIWIASNPEPYTTEFDKDRITLEFDEYIKLQDQSKLFVLSPPATKKPILMVRNKSIVVDFQEPLDSNTTYMMDFGTSIVDNNEGNPIEGLSFIFSTGAIIDSLIMSGQVIDAFTRDTIIDGYTFFFDPQADSLQQDSVMHKARAQAIFKTDSSGYFIASILKDKDYILYALKDMNDNQIYDAGTDAIGVASGTYNPVEQPSFTMRYDTIKKRWIIDTLQVIIEVFKEEEIKKQTLLEAKRVDKFYSYLAFNSKHTQIDTLEIDGIPNSWFMKQWNYYKDTLEFWLMPPTQIELDSLLIDTLNMRLAFQKEDTASVMRSFGQDLMLIFIPPKIEEETEEKGLFAGKGEDGEPISLWERIIIWFTKIKEKIKTKKIEKRRIKDSIKMAELGVIDTTFNMMDIDTLGIKSVLDMAANDTIIIQRATKDSLTGEMIVNNTLSTINDSTLLDSTLVDSTLMDSTLMQDSLVVVNPFSVQVQASTEFVPTNNLIFDFEYPLRKSDTTIISLFRYPVIKRRGVVVKDDNTKGVVTTYFFERDSMNPKRWVLSAEWQEQNDYELIIPSGAFENIALQSNDTLKSKFTVAEKRNFGSVMLNIIVSDSITPNQDINYIIEIYKKSKESDQITRRLFIDNKSQQLLIEYLEVGSYNLRIIEDRNKNRRWDTGSILKRLPAERVRDWSKHGQREELVSKENWEIEIDLDLNKIFER